MHLGQLVEAAECDVAIAQCRRRCDGNRQIRRREAVIDFRQTPDCLAEVRSLICWCHLRVSQQVIHRRHAGGGEIAQPGNLHRRRFPGEHRQARSGGMAGQINQDINRVVMDALRQNCVTQAYATHPASKCRLHSFGQIIVVRMRDIGKQFNRLRAQRGKYRFQKIAHRMIAQIARHQTDAKAFIRQRLHLPTRERLRPCRNQLTEVAGIFKHLFWWLLGDQVAGVEQIALRLEKFGLYLQRLLITGDRIDVLPQPGQGNAQIVQRLWQIRAGWVFQHSAITADGGLQPPHFHICIAHDNTGVVITRLKFQQTLAKRDSGFRLAQVLQNHRQIQQRLAIAGLQFQRPPVTGCSFVESAQVLIRLAEVVMHVSVTGIEPHRLQEIRNGALQIPHLAADDAKIGARRHVVWKLPGHLRIQVGGLAQITALMMGDGLFEEGVC